MLGRVTDRLYCACALSARRCAGCRQHYTGALSIIIGPSALQGRAGNLAKGQLAVCSNFPLPARTSSSTEAGLLEGQAGSAVRRTCCAEALIAYCCGYKDAKVL